MGLTVIMIVLIGVMGAGILTFVQRDLQSVIEVNQGQKAFEVADSGIQVARRELLSDAEPSHYDIVGTSNSTWAYKGTSGAPQQKTLSFAGGTITVNIQYLPPVVAPATPTSEQAPEVISVGSTELSSGCNYFKIKAYGVSSQAKRGAEAIYCASKLNVPTSYYTPKNIEFDGNVTMGGVSFFAGTNIKGSRSGSVSIVRTTPALYGDWDSTNFNPPSNHNTQPRTSGGVPVTGAGLAAEGRICANNACTVSVSDSFYNTYDYDGYSATKFCRKPAPSPSVPCSTTATVNDTNPSGTISYPFSPVDDFSIDFLKEEAQRQNRYFSSATDIDNAEYIPATSNDQTVFFVDAGGSTTFLKYLVNYTPQARGTIVVKDGNLRINNSSNGFNGVIILTGDGTTTGLYESSGTDTVKGFVIADGEMVIRGTVAPFAVTDDFTNRPGFYSVRLWSWRELYK